MHNCRRCYAPFRPGSSRKASANLAREGRRFDYLLVESSTEFLESLSPCGPSSGPPDRPDSSALSSTAEELIVTIGFKPGNADPPRHLNSLKNLSSSRIDSPQITFITFPRGVPELSIDPSDPGDEAVGLDSAKNRACIGIDLIDLSILILPDPERPFGPREPGVTATAGRGYGSEHSASLWIDLPNAILGNLKQVFAIKCRPCVRGDIDGAEHLPARRIEGVQLISRSKPDIVPVISDTIHPLDTGKGTILTNDFGV